MCHTSRTDSPSADDHLQCMLGIWYHNLDKLGSYERRERKNQTRKQISDQPFYQTTHKIQRDKRFIKKKQQENYVFKLGSGTWCLVKEYRTRLKNVFPIRVQISVVQVQVRYANSGPEYSEGIAIFFLREKKEWPNTGQP